MCLNAGVLAAEYFRLLDIGRPGPPIEWPYRTGPILCSTLPQVPYMALKR